MNIAIGIPHASDSFSGEFLDSIVGLFSALKCDYIWMRPKSALINRSRNQMFEAARNMDADYLLMIDSDMIFPADGVTKLIALDKDISTGVYCQKEEPFRPNIYRFTGNEVNVHENYSQIPSDPFKVDTTGGGFLLISKKVLKEWDYKLSGKPFNFIEHDDGNGGFQIGEDTSFCLRCKDKYEIWADPSIKLGHLGTMNVTLDFWEASRQTMLNKDRQADGIDGWTSPEELAFLSERAVDASNIAEIGSWKGRSTKVLCDASGGLVHAIDHFKGTDKSGDFWSGALAKEQDIYSQFMKNVGGYDNLIVHRMGSEDAVKEFDDGSLDLVFIDGDHTYKGVCLDIDNYLPKVRSGGTICGHDYTDGWPGVVKAVNERFGTVEVVGSIWYKKVA